MTLIVWAIAKESLVEILYKIDFLKEGEREKEKEREKERKGERRLSKGWDGANMTNPAESIFETVQEHESLLNW